MYLTQRSLKILSNKSQALEAMEGAPFSTMMVMSFPKQQAVQSG